MKNKIQKINYKYSQQVKFNEPNKLFINLHLTLLAQEKSNKTFVKSYALIHN